MLQSNIRKAYRTTKKANAILTEAGGTMLKSSFQTAKEIANLYREAGFKAFSFGKGMIRKTVELTVANQKELLKTSGEALKEVAQSIRAGAPEEEQQQDEPTIDDILNN